MELSDHEKQILAELEAQLREKDPELVKSMSETIPASKSSRPPTVKSLTLGLGLVVLGLCTLLGGVSLGYSILGTSLGVVGFLLMVCGVLCPFARRRNSAKRPRNPGKKDSPQKGSFMDRQRNRWDDRST